MHEFTTFIQEEPSGILYCIILLALGIWLLAKGGDYLVTGGLGLAKQLNIKTMVVGLTIIAFSTSSPELVFNIFAASGGSGEITVGNIFGSNIANLALVLGVGALVHNAVRRKQGEKKATHIDREFLIKEGGWLKYSTGGISILVGAIIWLGNSEDSYFNLNIGIGGIILIFFILFFWHVIIKHKSSSNSDEKEDTNNNCSLSKAIFLLIGGFILLIIGGKSAELGAVSGARIIGISEMFIGATIVAIATSLPELVITIVAAKRDQADLIWGNIVGSNLFNLLFVLPITLVVAYFYVGFIEIPTTYEPWFYMGVMCIVTLIAWYFMKKDEDITDKEGYSLVGIYFVFLITATVLKMVFG
jgi:cation:H+ antiporter